MLGEAQTVGEFAKMCLERNVSRVSPRAIHRRTSEGTYDSYLVFRGQRLTDIYSGSDSVRLTLVNRGITGIESADNWINFEFEAVKRFLEGQQVLND